jgi:hypothetical protein
MVRVCTYDRSGLGWSEPSSGSRDAETIAQQLHSLLDLAGVQRPLVLTAHPPVGFTCESTPGSFHSKSLASVLVDSTSPQQIDEVPGFRADYAAGKRHARRALVRQAASLVRLRTPNGPVSWYEPHIPALSVAAS